MTGAAAGVVRVATVVEPAPWLSVVVPLRNEAENVVYLVEEIGALAGEIGAFELILVDDASTDGTVAEAQRLAARGFLRLVAHDRRGGQSAAIHSGVRAARGAIICTLDGDGQNPPREIPRLLARLEGRAMPVGTGLIAGQRIARRDSLAKRLGSRFANGLRARLLRDGTRDTGCGLKVFARDAYLALPYFDHMHRFLPALFQRDGWRVVHVDVDHAPRRAGRSNYTNLARALVGVPDLIGVAWLIRRRKRARAEERELGA